MDKIDYYALESSVNIGLDIAEEGLFSKIKSKIPFLKSKNEGIGASTVSTTPVKEISLSEFNKTHKKNMLAISKKVSVILTKMKKDPKYGRAGKCFTFITPEFSSGFNENTNMGDISMQLYNFDIYKSGVNDVRDYFREDELSNFFGDLISQINALLKGTPYESDNDGDWDESDMGIVLPGYYCAEIDEFSMKSV